MILKDIILSIIQGITEFIPVSSSGHLVIFNKIFSASGDLFYYIMLHIGTALSIIVFFFKDIIKALRDFETIKKILIVTFTTGILGFLGKNFFEGLFLNYKFVIFALFINGSILVFSNKRINSFRKNDPSSLDSLILGFTQAIAIIPGISRSGITISTLLFRGVKKEEAFKFSFLAAIPIILASFIFEVKDKCFPLADLLLPKYIIGLVTAFLVGYISLVILRFLIKKARLDIFGYYCIIFSCLLWIIEMIKV